MRAIDYEVENFPEPPAGPVNDLQKTLEDLRGLHETLRASISTEVENYDHLFGKSSVLDALGSLAGQYIKIHAALSGQPAACEPEDLSRITQQDIAILVDYLRHHTA